MDLKAQTQRIPVEIEAEQALLGAMFVNPDCYDQACEILTADHFYEDLHARIFTLIGEALESAERVTPVLIDARLRGYPGYQDIGGSGYLVNLTAASVNTINVRSYCELIFETSVRRALVGIGMDLADTACATDRSGREIGEEAAAFIDRALETGRRRSAWQDMATALGAALDAAADAQSGKVRAVPFGCSRLDYDLSGGARDGDLVIVAGRPGMGKTVFGASWAVNAARAGHGVLFYSLEMPPVQIQHRIISDQMHRRGVNFPYERIRRGDIPEERWRDIEDARGELMNLPIRWMDAAGITAQGIQSSARARAREMARKSTPVGLIVIDYLGLIAHSGRYAGRKVDELGEITAALKTMARQLGVPVVCLHQLSRAVEQRDDRRPRLADLRDSGNIEQDADSVLLLYRPFYYHEQKRPDPSDDDAMAEWDAKADRMRHQFEVIIAKQRNGPTGVAPLFIDIPFAAIRDRGPS